ncbi:hypothetical protein D3C87_1304780 [compost metagenome]
MLDEETPVAQEGCVVDSGIPARVTGSEARAIPAHGGFVEAAAGVHVQWLGVVSGVRGIADESQQFVFCTRVVAATTTNECSVCCAINEHGLFVSFCLGDMKCENRAFSQGVCCSIDGETNADLVLIAYPSEECVLHRVGVGDARDDKRTVGLLHTEYQIPSRCVGESADSFKRILGRSPSRFLEFDVAPFDGLEPGEEFVAVHLGIHLLAQFVQEPFGPW